MIRFYNNVITSGNYNYDFSSVISAFKTDGKLDLILGNIRSLFFNPDDGRYRRNTLKAQNLTFAEILYANTYVNPDGDLEKDIETYESYMEKYYDGVIIRVIMFDKAEIDEAKFLFDHSSDNRNKLITVFVPSYLSDNAYYRFIFKFIDILLIERFVNLVPSFDSQIYKSDEGYELLACTYCDSATFIFIYNYLQTLVEKYVNITNYISKNANEIFELLIGYDPIGANENDILIEMVKEININILDRKEYDAEELVSRYYKKLKETVEG